MTSNTGLTPKYKRIVLKISGEALKEGCTDGILNFDLISEIADVLKKCRDAGVEIAIIVGAGNIWRGRQGGTMNRVRADSMGMLATVINALALQDTFKAAGLDSVVMTAVEMNAFADQYSPRHAIRELEAGKIVIFGGGEPLEVEGKIIGALGVSGGTAEQDTMLAAYGKEILKEVISCL